MPKRDLKPKIWTCKQKLRQRETKLKIVTLSISHPSYKQTHLASPEGAGGTYNVLVPNTDTNGQRAAHFLTVSDQIDLKISEHILLTPTAASCFLHVYLWATNCGRPGSHCTSPKVPSQSRQTHACLPKDGFKAFAFLNSFGWPLQNTYLWICVRRIQKKAAYKPFAGQNYTVVWIWG